MTLTQNITIQQGDTTKIVVPVLDGDDPDNQFLPNLDGLTVNATIAESFDAPSPLVSISASQIDVRAFGNVKLSEDAFAEVDQIPDAQDVIVISLPASTTASFVGGSTLVYQVRLIEPSRGELTPVKGDIQVAPSAPF